MNEQKRIAMLHFLSCVFASLIVIIGTAKSYNICVGLAKGYLMAFVIYYGFRSRVKGNKKPKNA